MTTFDGVLDFRSDTFTRPGPGMRHAMAQATVGDDVFGEDPSVNELERTVAARFGRQAAVFVPSGTMANLIGLALHCQRGDEVIMERRTHSFAHEVGGGSALLGILFHPIDNAQGYLSVADVQKALRPIDVHAPISRLLVVENTANLCGGKIVPIEDLRRLRTFSKDKGLRLHLDGARIWNASVASGVPLSDWAAEANSLSCCLSKGLGCPVGSLIIGDEADMHKARWLRKMLGGGMRQAGILAACGLYAIERHVQRLAKDHQCATELALGLESLLDERFRVEGPETNILILHTDSPQTTEETVAAWKQAGILCFGLGGTTIRLVTHLDLPEDAAAEALRRIRHLG